MATPINFEGKTDPFKQTERIAQALGFRRIDVGKGIAHFVGPNPTGMGAQVDGFELMPDGQGYDRKLDKFYSPAEMAMMANVCQTHLLKLANTPSVTATAKPGISFPNIKSLRELRDGMEQFAPGPVISSGESTNGTAFHGPVDAPQPVVQKKKMTPDEVLNFTGTVKPSDTSEDFPTPPLKAEKHSEEPVVRASGYVSVDRPIVMRDDSNLADLLKHLRICKSTGSPLLIHKASINNIKLPSPFLSQVIAGPASFDAEQEFGFAGGGDLPDYKKATAESVGPETFRPHKPIPPQSARNVPHAEMNGSTVASDPATTNAAEPERKPLAVDGIVAETLGLDPNRRYLLDDTNMVLLFHDGLWKVRDHTEQGALRKPPRGVMPKKHWFEARAIELTRAIGDYMHYGLDARTAKLVDGWMDELSDIFYDLAPKDDPEPSSQAYKEGQRVGEVVSTALRLRPEILQMANLSEEYLRTSGDEPLALKETSPNFVWSLLNDADVYIIQGRNTARGMKSNPYLPQSHETARLRESLLRAIVRIMYAGDICGAFPPSMMDLAGAPASDPFKSRG